MCSVVIVAFSVYAVLCAVAYLLLFVTEGCVLRKESNYVDDWKHDFILAFQESPVAFTFAILFSLFIAFMIWWYIVPYILSAHVAHYNEVKYVI